MSSRASLARCTSTRWRSTARWTALGRADFLACAANAGLAKARAATIIGEVREAVPGWRLVAEGAGVHERRIDVIARKTRYIGEYYR